MRRKKKNFLQKSKEFVSQFGSVISAFFTVAGIFFGIGVKYEEVMKEREIMEDRNQYALDKLEQQKKINELHIENEKLKIKIGNGKENKKDSLGNQ